MGTHAPVFVLDHECLLGTHRLLYVISQPFDRLILPPDAVPVVWPTDIEIAEFALEVLAKRRGFDAAYEQFDKVVSGQSDIQDMLKTERDRVWALVEKLRGMGRLEIPDYENWPASWDERQERRTRNYVRKQRVKLQDTLRRTGGAEQHANASGPIVRIPSVLHRL